MPTLKLGRVVGPPGPGGGESYKFGHGLKQEGDTISVIMASDENPDKTLPISAAELEAALGNIETILKTI